MSTETLARDEELAQQIEEAANDLAELLSSARLCGLTVKVDFIPMAPGRLVSTSVDISRTTKVLNTAAPAGPQIPCVLIRTIDG